MKELKITSQFKKDLKRYQNKTKKIEKLKIVLSFLQQDITIPQEYKPHRLLGTTRIVWSVTLKMTHYLFGLIKIPIL